MSRRWIDYIAAISALLAMACYLLASVLRASGFFEERTLLANLLVGYATGFFGAWFLQRFCDLAKRPKATIGWAWNSFGADRSGRVIASLLVPPFAALGVALIFAPILGSPDPSTLIAVLIGGTLFSEFTAPSYRMHQAELHS